MPDSMPDAQAGRVDVRKTCKLYVGGAFVRSESGRTYVVEDAEGRFVANAALASRKDARDAVVAARAAFAGWAGRTPYNRGQVVYRVAEMLEGRRAELAGAVSRGEGVSARRADGAVSAAVDRLVWYAGWADKLAAVLGSASPVAGRYLGLSSPQPTGVVAVVAPQDSSLLGLVSVLAPAVVTGNTVVVLAAQARPLPAVTLAEVLATSDVPVGVVNVLTGGVDEVAPWLASHMDVDAVDLAGVTGPGPARDLEAHAAGNLKRVLRPREESWTDAPDTSRMAWALQTKSVWHPIGV